VGWGVMWCGVVCCGVVKCVVVWCGVVWCVVWFGVVWSHECKTRCVTMGWWGCAKRKESTYFQPLANERVLCTGVLVPVYQRTS